MRYVRLRDERGTWRWLTPPLGSDIARTARRKTDAWILSGRGEASRKAAELRALGYEARAAR